MHPENSRNYLVPYDERNANRAKKIRCRRCGQRSFEGLTICPSCGRNLRAALSRWITWGIPLAVAALLLLSVWGVSGRSPLAWATSVAQGMGNLMTNLGAQIEPRLTAPDRVLTQAPPTQNQSASAQPSNVSEVAIITPVSIQEPADESEAAAAAPLAIDETDSLSESAADNSNTSETAVEAVSVLDPTSTPVSLAQVAQPISDTPADTPEPEPTNTPTTEPTATDTPTDAPTDAPADTATPVDTPESATPTPQPQYRAEAIKLQLPEPGTVLDCGQENRITWQPPLSLVATDKFLLNLGYISSQNGDQYVVTWIAEPKFSIDETSWVLDPAYCKLSPDGFNDQWVWTMQVIDENNDAVSEPSRPSYFVWQKPL